MTTAGTIPELLAPQSDLDDAAEVSRCLERAAELVEAFARRGAIGALDSLIAAASNGAEPKLAPIRESAQVMVQQARTLEAEVGRFLSLIDRR